MQQPVLLRRLGLATLAGLLAAGCAGSIVVDGGADRAVAPAPVSATSPPVSPSDASAGLLDDAGLRTVLDDVAEAFLRADPESVRAHLLDEESQFGVEWLERVSNLAEVPLASYALELDESLPDLATERVRGQYPDGVQVRYVVERHAIDGFDETPAAEDLFLTVVPTRDGWKLASDRDAEALGLVSVDHLWDHGPVRVTIDGPVAALHHPDGPAVGPLLAEARSALRTATERWPLAWPERVPIIVPRDEEELGELLHVTFDLSNFVAFATATPVSVLGTYELTGSRIVLNPGRFLNRAPETRESILVHELLHVATRPASGPMVPSWLEEGIAQALGEQRSTTGTRLVDALGTSSVALPTDGEFTVGGRDRIFLSYQLAWAFVDHLRRTHGADQVAALYEAVGRGALEEPGNEAAQVDRAATEVFGRSLEALVQEWRATR